MTRNPLLALLCVASSSLAGAVEYSLVDLGLGPSQQFATPYAIDAHGVVAGAVVQGSHYARRPVLFAAGHQVDLARQAGLASAQGEARAIHARGGVAGRVDSLEWRDGALFVAGPAGVEYAPIPYPPRKFLEVSSINAHGVVAGLTWTPDAQCLCGFVYRQGRFEFLYGPNGQPVGGVTALDDDGHVYGQAQFGAHPRAAVWRDGTVHRLPDLGGSSSSVGAISRSGIVVGTSALPGRERRHAMRLDGRTAVDLDGDARSTSEAYGVNDQAVVVGRRLRDGRTTAFVHHPGSGMRELNPLLPEEQQAEWDITSAVDINDAGQIAALAQHRHTGRQHAVRLDPTP